MDTRTIFFVGKPGCGKGTQAELLSKATGWPIVSAGEQLRVLARDSSVLGRKVKEVMQKGALVPDWLAMHLYLIALIALPETNSIIFDGFSRELSQAKLIDKSLRWLERPYTVLHVAISDESVHKRLALRAQTSGRADDHVVNERLTEYYEHTEPAIAKFREAGVLVEINGEQTPEAIATDIRAALKIDAPLRV